VALLISVMNIVTILTRNKMTKEQILSKVATNKLCSEIQNNLQELIIFQETLWVTKTKEEIKIKDLSLNHLQNIVRYLKNKFNSLSNPFNYYPLFQGEMAQMYAEQQWESQMEEYVKLEKTIKLFECYLKLKSL